MKATSHLVVVAACLLFSACSSSTTTTDSAGTSTAGSSVTDAASSNNATSGAATGSDVVGGSGGSIVGSGTNNTASDASSGRSATDVASDIGAFTATFATMDDPQFMLTAASSNMLEIQMGQLAAQRGSHAEVKKFGQMMVDHHGKATQNWQAVAQPMGVAMPTTLMPVHQAIMERVTNKSGKNFDEAYMDAMETVHKLDIAMFEAKSKTAQNPAVQSFATSTLPMLRAHGTLADKLEEQVD